MKADADKTKLKGCSDYFLKNKGFSRSFRLMRDKWKSYGEIKGKIRLDNPGEEERRALEGLFSKRFGEGDIVFSMKQFENALQATKYNGVGLTDLFEEYFNEPLMSNKQIEDDRRSKTDEFFEKLRQKIIEEIYEKRDRYDSNLENKYYFLGLEWFDNVSKKVLLNAFSRQESTEEKENTIIGVCNAIEYLFGEGYKDRIPVRLAFLATKCLGNPHGFDRKVSGGRLLIRALREIQQKKEGVNNLMLQPDGECFGTDGLKATFEEDDKNRTEDSSAGDAEVILDLYIRNGIRPDDISSFTTLYGIDLLNSGVCHPAFRAFIERNEQYVVTLSNLQGVTEARPVNKKVFVVENQGVFSELCERCPNASIICTSGQFKTASALVLSLIVGEKRVNGREYEIYYSGDLDPEGMDIALRLKRLLGNELRFWHMDELDYEKSKSEKKISGSGMRRIERLKKSCFVNICSLIEKNGIVGQQELLIEEMVQDILM